MEGGGGCGGGAPPGNPFLWRKRARIVAYTDMVLSGCSLLVLMYLVLMALVATSLVAGYAAADAPITAKVDAGKLIVVIWLLVAISVAFLGYNIWATIQLLNATCEFGGHPPATLLLMTKPWRNTNIILIALQTCSLLVADNPCGIFLSLCIRGAFVFIVLKYMKELKAATVEEVDPVVKGELNL